MLHVLYGVDWCLVLSCCMLIVCSVIWFFFIVAFFYGKLHLHKTVNRRDVEKLGFPGVSIAKPLCGSRDPNILENLSSYFTLDYPQYELLICIQDEESLELINVVQGLLTQHPDVDARVFIGAQDVGLNPKVNNMMNAYNKAKYPLFMISDSNVKVEEDTLLDMVSHLTEKVGLVHQIPTMCDSSLDAKFSRQVEKQWFGGAQARVYLAANALGLNCMTSMSCLFRKKIIDEMGGLQKLGCYIGEDFFLAQMIINKGWRLKLSSKPALQNAGFSSIAAYQTRMKRWQYIRQTEMPLFVLFEPLTEHILMGPLTGLALKYLFQIPLYLSVPSHFLLWCLADYILFSVMNRTCCPMPFLTYIKAWVFREFSPLYMTPAVCRMRHISWGGKHYKIRFGGLAERVDQPSLDL